MRPVRGCIKGFDKRSMMRLHVFERLRLLKLKIGQAQLHFELGFNQVLPGFAFLNMERLDP